MKGRSIKDEGNIGRQHEAVVPSDTTTFAPSWLYVGGTGTITVVLSGGSNAEAYHDFHGFMPQEVVKVMATGTDANMYIIRIRN